MQLETSKSYLWASRKFYARGHGSIRTSADNFFLVRHLKRLPISAFSVIAVYGGLDFFGNPSLCYFHSISKQDYKQTTCSEAQRIYHCVKQEIQRENYTRSVFPHILRQLGYYIHNDI
jgi:hypothetical protein